jgi:anti-sigma B factor antagonist
MISSASVAVQAHQARVLVTGDLDLLTALQVRAQLESALAQGCTGFAVDTTGLTFIDAAGLDAFVRLHNATTRLGGTLTFGDASPTFRRTCRLAGLTEAFHLAA